MDTAVSCGESGMLWEVAPATSSGVVPSVRCLACAHACVIPPGNTGRCAVRANHNGTLCTLVGSSIVSAAIDPIEKKPLYHYLPGTHTFSIGTEGCNFSCTFCQNAAISQHPRLYGAFCPDKAGQGNQFMTVTPEQIVLAAHEHNCASIAFTYNEPTVFVELAVCTATLARAAGLGTVLVSNGFQSPAALALFGPVITAANIDLKSMEPAFYRDLCGGRLEPVLDNLTRMRSLGWWLEITTLIIPGHNDSPGNLTALARFIATKLGTDTPWHVSAFRPAFLLQDAPPTPVSTLDMAREYGYKAGLRFVYAGNVPAEALATSNNTACPACTMPCIVRHGWQTAPFDGICPTCASRLAGVWNPYPDG